MTSFHFPLVCISTQFSYFPWNTAVGSPASQFVYVTGVLLVIQTHLSSSITSLRLIQYSPVPIKKFFTCEAKTELIYLRTSLKQFHISKFHISCIKIVYAGVRYQRRKQALTERYSCARVVIVVIPQTLLNTSPYELGY